MRGGRAQKVTIDGVVFDSTAEGCFYCWCKEAKQKGILSDFILQPHYPMTPTQYRYEEVQLKTKTKFVQRTLLQASGYTADFIVSKVPSLPVNSIGGLLMPLLGYNTDVYVVDVKGAFNKAASEFSLTQKMLWHTCDVYANKVVVAYDTKKYSVAKCATGFFAMNGVPATLPRECYQKDGVTLYAVWRRMFEGLPTIDEVFDGTM